MSKRSLTNTSPELSRVRPSSGKFLVSYPVKRWIPPHLPTVPEHRFRESSQMAAHDSFASSGPNSWGLQRTRLRRKGVLQLFRTHNGEESQTFSSSESVESNESIAKKSGRFSEKLSTGGRISW